jgi:hypothetical protein
MKRVAEKLDMDEEYVEAIVTACYKYLRMKLSNIEYPRIFVPGLGTFEVKRRSLVAAIKKSDYELSRYPDNERINTENALFKKTLEEIDRIRTVRREVIQLKYANRNSEKLRENS